MALFCLLFQRYASALLLSTALRKFIKATKKDFFFGIKNRPGFLFRKPRRFIMLYSCFLKRSRNYLRGFLIAAWAGAKITERSDLR